MKKQKQKPVHYQYNLFNNKVIDVMRGNTLEKKQIINFLDKQKNEYRK